MIAKYRLPVLVRWLLGSAIAGLVLGILLSFFTQKSINFTLEDEWDTFPELGEKSLDTEVKALLDSPQWSITEVTAESAEGLREVHGRPGVLAYLSVLAISREPKISALLHVTEVPTSLAGELLISPDSSGLASVHAGSEVTKGWYVIDISENSVTLGNTADAGGNEPQEAVKYNLYEW
jgi:hypothetical protein